MSVSIRNEIPGVSGKECFPLWQRNQVPFSVPVLSSQPPAHPVHRAVKPPALTSTHSSHIHTHPPTYMYESM